ncbi:MAG: hypothetical protein IBX64_10035 [Actinobacteria bacterium]|nr:hypothetical protein [Actinomycetota bacterium]
MRGISQWPRANSQCSLRALALILERRQKIKSRSQKKKRIVAQGFSPDKKAVKAINYLIRH